MMADIKVLSSDEFEGRAPGSKGEELTVKFLQDAFTTIGVRPGNTDGTFIQPLPLVGITATNTRPLTITGKGKKTTFRWRDDVVAWTKRVADTAAIENSELIFAGYGVTAPEFNWDDFKDVDVKGKTILVLVNDPQIPSASDPSQLDATLFNGKAMTYYGRWTYKFEEGARRGAAGILIVHETGPAGYPFTVVQGNLDEKFDLVTADKNMGRASIEAWVTLDAAKKLLAQAGQDFDALKKQALTARLPAGAARLAGLTGHPQLAAHDSVEERDRQAGRQRPSASRRVRRLHGALGSSRQGRGRGW